MTAARLCNGCHRPLRWSEQKRGWGVLVSHGYAKERASAAMPLCSRCARRRLKDEDLASYWWWEVARPNGSKAVPHREAMELLRRGQE